MGSGKDTARSDTFVGFIKGLKYLEEHHQAHDLFGYLGYASKLAERLDAISMPASITALIGPYGIGKTFLLSLIRAEKDDGKTFWFTFESWGYPDRNDLWVAFLAELDDEIIDDSSDYEIVRKAKRIWHNLEKLRRYETFFSILVFLVVYLAVGLFIVFKTLGLEGSTNAVALLALAVSSVSLLLVSMDLYRGNPLVRREGYESIFKDSVKKLSKIGKRELFVVLEDVDRSGDHGLLFIETLALFLRRLSKQDLRGLSVKILVPISDESYGSNKERNSLLKAVDYHHPFGIQQLDLGQFIDTVFSDDVDGVSRGYAEEIFRTMFYTFAGARLNLRTWKTVLRGANDRYVYLASSVLAKPEPIACIVVEAMKHLKASITIREATGSLFDEATSNEVVRFGPFAKALIGIVLGQGPGSGFAHKKEITIDRSMDLTQHDSGILVGKEQSATGGTRIDVHEVNISRCYFDEIY